jgi:hypothetical protein
MVSIIFADFCTTPNQTPYPTFESRTGSTTTLIEALTVPKIVNYPVKHTRKPTPMAQAGAE